jgi:hypothetical protein
MNRTTRTAVRASAITVALTALLIGTPASAMADHPAAGVLTGSNSDAPLIHGTSTPKCNTGPFTFCGGPTGTLGYADLLIDGAHWTPGDDIRLFVNYPQGLKDDWGQAADWSDAAALPDGTVHWNGGCYTGPSSSTLRMVSVGGGTITAYDYTSYSQFTPRMPVTLVKDPKTGTVVCPYAVRR